MRASENEKLIIRNRNGLDFKAARRPYYLADEVSYERFVLAYYIGDAVEPHNLLACLDLRHVR